MSQNTDICIENTNIVHNASTNDISKNIINYIPLQKTSLTSSPPNIIKIVSKDDVNKFLTSPALDNKIYVIPLKTTERKYFHRYLEKEYPKLGKISLKSKHFHDTNLDIYIKCHHCGHKRVPVDQYQYGTLENVKDVYKSGLCLNCGKNVNFKPNYDNWDDITIVSENNMIVLGIYFKLYLTSRHIMENNIQIDYVVTMLMNTVIYEMDSPKIWIDTYKITNYIDEILSKIV